MSKTAVNRAERKARVVIVDDHTFIRDGLSEVLQRGKFEVVGEAGTVAEGIIILNQLRPELIIVDLRLADGSGIQLLESAHKLRWQTYAVVLTAFRNDDDVIAAARAGSRAYLCKNERGEVVLQKLRRVLDGENLLEEELAKELRPRLLEKDLTIKETQILRLLGKGLSNPEICRRTNLKPNTVKTHLRNLFTKLRVTNRTQAAAVATRRGLD